MCWTHYSTRHFASYVGELSLLNVILGFCALPTLGSHTFFVSVMFTFRRISATQFLLLDIVITSFDKLPSNYRPGQFFLMTALPLLFIVDAAVDIVTLICFIAFLFVGFFLFCSLHDCYCCFCRYFISLLMYSLLSCFNLLCSHHTFLEAAFFSNLHTSYEVWRSFQAYWRHVHH